MNIITLVTKKSVRETSNNLRYKKHYSSANYNPGDMIEIIDGNRKSPAIIIKTEDASTYKQSIRDGSLTIHPLKLSKTGSYAHGKIIESFGKSEVLSCLKNPTLAQQSTHKTLQSFFPKKRKQVEKTKRLQATSDGTLATLSISRYTQQEKTHSTELQLFVDEVRTYFNEQARYGQGSFSYYLGFCKKIPLQNLWQMFGESKQARGKTRFEQKKLFWWKIGQHLKEKKNQQ